MSTNREPYRTDREVTQVLRRFESGELSPGEFKHRAHLTVALLYSLRLPAHEATARMRRSLQRFIEHHGLGPGVYHETLTRFWMKRVGAYVRRAEGARTLAELANELLDACDDSRLVYHYYTREMLDSERARLEWVEPDVRPLDFDGD